MGKMNDITYYVIYTKDRNYFIGSSLIGYTPHFQIVKHFMEQCVDAVRMHNFNRNIPEENINDAIKQAYRVMEIDAKNSLDFIKKAHKLAETDKKYDFLKYINMGDHELLECDINSGRFIFTAEQEYTVEEEYYYGSERRYFMGFIVDYMRFTKLKKYFIDKELFEKINSYIFEFLIIIILNIYCNLDETIDTCEDVPLTELGESMVSYYINNISNYCIFPFDLQDVFEEYEIKKQALYVSINDIVGEYLLPF